MAEWHQIGYHLSWLTSVGRYPSNLSQVKQIINSHVLIPSLGSHLGTIYHYLNQLISWLNASVFHFHVMRECYFISNMFHGWCHLQVRSHFMIHIHEPICSKDPSRVPIAFRWSKSSLKSLASATCFEVFDIPWNCVAAFGRDIPKRPMKFTMKTSFLIHENPWNPLKIHESKVYQNVQKSMNINENRLLWKIHEWSMKSHVAIHENMSKDPWLKRSLSSGWDSPPWPPPPTPPSPWRSTSWLVSWPRFPMDMVRYIRIITNLFSWDLMGFNGISTIT